MCQRSVLNYRHKVILDVATRTITAAVLRPEGTKAVDAAVLLARMLVPEQMRPGWDEALAMARSALPFHRLADIDQRLAGAAARPVIIPGTQEWRGDGPFGIEDRDPDGSGARPRYRHPGHGAEARGRRVRARGGGGPGGRSFTIWMTRAPDVDVTIGWLALG